MADGQRVSKASALNVSIVHARRRQVKMTIRQEMNESDSEKSIGAFSP